MAQQAIIPSAFRRPRAWWLVVLSLVLVCLAAGLVGSWFRSTQLRVLAENHWNVYLTQKSGSPSGKILHLALNPDGLLWVGTEKGLLAFDGRIWTSHLAASDPHPLRASAVYSVVTDRHGITWVVFDMGLGKISQGQLTPVEGYFFGPLAIDSQGRAWASNSGDHGIAPLTAQGLGEELPGTDPKTNIRRWNPNVMIFGPDDRLWIGGLNLLSVYDWKEWHDYEIDTIVTALAFDPQGRLWISDESYPLPPCCSLQVLEPQSGQWTRVDVPYPDRKEAQVSALAFDSKGRLWVAFSGNIPAEIGMYAGQGWVFYRTADAVDPLDSKQTGCRTFLIDPADHVWAGVSSVLVELDIGGSLPGTDPVPQGILIGRRMAHQIMLGSGILAGFLAIGAVWASLLNSRKGRDWAQRLKDKPAEARLPEKPSTNKWLPILIAAMLVCLAAWAMILFFYSQGEASNLTENGKPNLQAASTLLVFLAPMDLVTAIISGLLFFFGFQGARQGRTPTRLTLGILGMLFAGLLFIAAVLFTFYAVGMLTTG